MDWLTIIEAFLGLCGLASLGMFALGVVVLIIGNSQNWMPELFAESDDDKQDTRRERQRYDARLKQQQEQHEAQWAAWHRTYVEENRQDAVIREELFGYIARSTKTLDEALAELPKIQKMDEYFGSMSKKMKDELTFPLSPVFAQGTAQITAQQIEAVRKHHEIGQRLSLYLRTVKMEKAALPAGLDAELAIAYELYQLFQKWNARIVDPAFYPITDAITAKAAAKLINESKLAEGLVTPNAITRLFLAAREERERLASNPDQKQRIVGLNSTSESSFEAALSGIFGDFSAARTNPRLNRGQEEE
jgi:hypothetical protein